MDLNLGIIFNIGIGIGVGSLGYYISNIYIKLTEKKYDKMVSFQQKKYLKEQESDNDKIKKSGLCVYCNDYETFHPINNCYNFTPKSFINKKVNPLEPHILYATYHPPIPKSFFSKTVLKFKQDFKSLYNNVKKQLIRPFISIMELYKSLFTKQDDIKKLQDEIKKLKSQMAFNEFSPKIFNSNHPETEKVLVNQTSNPEKIPETEKVLVNNPIKICKLRPLSKQKKLNESKKVHNEEKIPNGWYEIEDNL
jgi:hypothetical protein